MKIGCEDHLSKEAIRYTNDEAMVADCVKHNLIEKLSKELFKYLKPEVIETWQGETHRIEFIALSIDNVRSILKILDDHVEDKAMLKVIANVLGGDKL